MARRTSKPAAAGALLLLSSALVVAFPARLAAQGHSGDKGKGHSGAPSSSPLPTAAAPPPGIGATPIAWVDDANLMPSGAMSVDVSISHWEGDGFGETSAPIVNFTVGLADRFQLAVSVPHVVADETSGVTGGIGTTYVSGKYAAYLNSRGLKIAVAPTLELLGTGVLSSLGPDETRAQFGVPVSVEMDDGGRRLYASAGWFSRGVWFAGAGFGVQVRPRVGISGSFSRSWTGTPDDPLLGVPRDRSELSGGVAYALAPHLSVFASAGHTIATLPENGAGATLSAGMSFYIAPSDRRVTPKRH
jgi:hypothetical protein